MVNIEDEPSRYKAVIDKKVAERNAEYIGLGGQCKNIQDYGLLKSSRNDLFEVANETALEANGNVILDISSLPKRFFFPFLKILLRNDSVHNLVVTYSIPRCYESHNNMAEDYEEWRPLPLFEEPQPKAITQLYEDLRGTATGANDSKRHLIVGVGHVAMGLPELVREAAATMAIHALLPVGGDPRSAKLNWRFMEEIERNLPPDQNHNRIVPVPTRDVSAAFDTISALINSGDYVIFAPYGPKPISLAMCIYASLSSSMVGYTQPAVYNPDYSIGIANNGPEPSVYAYCIRMNGKQMFEI